MSAQTHHANPQILDRRTLERNHRALAPLLEPGQSVLDIGCGTGAITAGIARRVAPGGFVLGIDRDESLLEIAREKCCGQPGIDFLKEDIFTLSDNTLAEKGYPTAFDVVTAARVLQWVSDPYEALEQMKALTKPDGTVVVLDYDHSLNEWHPSPPKEFQMAYQAFLDWREANGWDNRMATNLPALFERVGFREVRVLVEDEVVRRGDEGFGHSSLLWLDVLDSVGARLVSAGLLSEEELSGARDVYAQWASEEMEWKRLHLRAVLGRVD